MDRQAHFEKEQSEYLKALGLQIVKLRKKKKMSRVTLAESLQTHTQYILDVEAGRKNPSIYVVARFARALDMSMPELLKSLSLKPID